jgi:hypothetical protein
VVPTFCRHNRLIDNCSICSKKERVDLSAVKDMPDGVKRERRKSAVASKGTTERQAAKGITVRRLARAEDDGYDNELLPGLRATADAERLARELVISAERIEAIPSFSGDVEEVLWREFQHAVIGRSDVAGSAWAGGDNPGPQEPGPRGVAADRQSALWQRYRAWADTHDGQLAALTAGASGSPESRFDRAYERLSIAGLQRPNRIEFLLTAAASGALPDIEVWTPRFGDAAATDPVLIAAKRIFGIGDPLLLQRRLRVACKAAGVPVSAADRALWNWATASGEDRVGGSIEADPERISSAAAAFGA